MFTSTAFIAMKTSTTCNTNHTIQLLLILAMTFSVAGASDPPLVFAHYMLYAQDTPDTLKKEIQLARSKGIDAFSLNTNVWRPERADAIFQAAKDLNTTFKLFFSADIHKDDSGNLSPANIIEMMTRYKSHPNQLAFQEKLFFSAWLGSDDSWWKSYTSYTTAQDGWKDLFVQAGGKSKYFFVPFFPNDGSYDSVKDVIARFVDVVDGLMAWDKSAWPFDSTLQAPSDQNDIQSLKACKDNGKTYMATPSPWFFKNIATTTTPSPCCSDKCSGVNKDDCDCQVKGNYRGPNLWIARWQQIVKLGPPLVQIVTWNDWAESSYVSPPLSTGASGVSRFGHSAFLDLGEHYIRWLKTGSEPSITEEKLYLFYYTNSKDATASEDGCKVANSGSLSDEVFVTAVLIQPGSVVLRSGSGGSQTFDAPAGINTFSMHFSEGNQSASLNRGGAVVKNVAGAFPIANSGLVRYNFNVYSTSS